MKIKFMAPAVLVNNVSQSKYFYETVLKQDIEMDTENYVSFIDGFSIWNKKMAHEQIFSEKKAQANNENSHDFELYFETENLDDCIKYIKENNIKIIHEIHEHPWGQRGFRVYDPDNHVVEISEPLSIVVKRFSEQGLSIKDISTRTFMPEDLVKDYLNR